MKNLLFLLLLLFPIISKGQQEAFKQRMKNTKFEGKPTKIIISFPDSINAYKECTKLLLKNAIQLKAFDESIGMIQTDYFKGPYEKDIKQNCMVFIENNVATISGRYHAIEPIYQQVMEGEAQVKGWGTSLYRNAFYNLIYVFRDYIDEMTFE